MAQDRVRILKLLIYEGPRDIIEEHVKHTIFGTQHHTYNGRHPISEKKLFGEYSITGYSLVAFPEIIIPQEEIVTQEDIAP